MYIEAALIRDKTNIAKEELEAAEKKWKEELDEADEN